jgi:hypothetical protein
VVDARQPEGFVALHAGAAGEGVLDRAVKRVPHVERPRHVRRGQHYAVGGLVRVGSASKAPVRSTPRRGAPLRRGGRRFLVSRSRSRNLYAVSSSS